jgi:uncharacterized LabA/DUF88 family protein
MSTAILINRVFLGADLYKRGMQVQVDYDHWAPAIPDNNKIESIVAEEYGPVNFKRLWGRGIPPGYVKQMRSTGWDVINLGQSHVEAEIEIGIATTLMTLPPSIKTIVLFSGSGLLMMPVTICAAAMEIYIAGFSSSISERLKSSATGVLDLESRHDWLMPKPNY